MPQIRLTLAVAALAAASAGSALAASPNIQGDWLTQSGTGKVRIAPCGPKVCGTIVWLKSPNDRETGRPQLDRANPDPAARTRPVLGLQILKGFSEGTNGRWTGGKIYDPQSGRTYDSKLSLTPEGALKVEGCISVICQAQTWRHAD